MRIHPDPRWHGLAGLLLALLIAAAPAHSSAPADPAEMNTAELRAAIEALQERLVEFLRTPHGADDTPAYASPELREIAARLPDLQRRLRERTWQPDKQGER